MRSPLDYSDIPEDWQEPVEPTTFQKIALWLFVILILFPALIAVVAAAYRRWA